MKARRGYLKYKSDSPHIGRWLKRYFLKRTCKRQSSTLEMTEEMGGMTEEEYLPQQGSKL